MAVFLWPPVSVTTLPPLGGATSANQLTEIAALQSIDAKNPALVGGKVPVDTGLAQALTDTQLRATPVPVSGTVSTGGLTDAQLRATPVPVSGTVTANAGTNLNTSALALEATQLLVKAKTDNLDVALSTRNLEATQLLIKAKTDNLDVALSTRATETTLAAQSAKLPATIGQKAMAASLAVTVASDQSPIPTSSTPASISGTITTAQKSLPTANTAVRATVSGSALVSNKKRKIKPASSNTGRVWYGSSGVTISNGIEIIGPDYITLDGDFSDYYVVSDTNTQIVEILEVV